MKLIQKWQAKDGSEWDNQDDCEGRENLIDLIDKIMEPLGHAPREVENGKGWCQHNPETVNLVKDALFEFFRSYQGTRGFAVFHENRGRDVDPLGVVGHILCDYQGPIANAWGRICCIDQHGREHQQPFYAANGPLPEHFCVQTR